MKLLGIKYSVCVFVILSLYACTHQSSIAPSNAHLSIPAAAGETETTQESPVKQSPQAHHQIPHQAETLNNTVLSLAADAPVYSIVVYDTPVREVLFAMARDSKINIDIHPAIDGRVTPLAQDAARLVLNGTTSLDEAMRVVDLNRQIRS